MDSLRFRLRSARACVKRDVMIPLNPRDEGCLSGPKEIPRMHHASLQILLYRDRIRMFPRSSNVAQSP